MLFLIDSEEIGDGILACHPIASRRHLSVLTAAEGRMCLQSSRTAELIPGLS